MSFQQKHIQQVANQQWFPQHQETLTTCNRLFTQTACTYMNKKVTTFVDE